MPTLARFYGIKIHMYWREHPPPHLHADYQGHYVVIDIESLETIEGGLPRRAHALLLEWAVVHRVELRNAWRAVHELTTPPTIEPLD